MARGSTRTAARQSMAVNKASLWRSTKEYNRTKAALGVKQESPAPARLWAIQNAGIQLLR